MAILLKDGSKRTKDYEHIEHSLNSLRLMHITTDDNLFILSGHIYRQIIQLKYDLENEIINEDTFADQVAPIVKFFENSKISFHPGLHVEEIRAFLSENEQLIVKYFPK